MAKKTQRYEFSVRRGFHVRKETAERVGRLIVELTDKGTYSPEELVHAASDPACPAHEDFEWNDSKAAHKWRVKQAVNYQEAITYSLVVTGPRGGKPKTIQMRTAYPFVDADGARSYHSGAQVVRDSDLLEQLKSRALAALESWKAQYEMLSGIGEFVGIFREIKKVIRKPAKVAPAGASTRPPARAERQRQAARKRPVKRRPLPKPSKRPPVLHA